MAQYAGGLSSDSSWWWLALVQARLPGKNSLSSLVSASTCFVVLLWCFVLVLGVWGLGFLLGCLCLEVLFIVGALELEGWPPLFGNYFFGHLLILF